MARPLRLEYPGALWHITSRGNEKKEIVRNDDDRLALLDRISDACLTFHWILHAYVLMTNHYHLLVETPEPNLSRGMQQLNGSFAQWFNTRHRRVGHLFQGRFKGILVERESHFLELTRYVVLNPVRAGMVKRAEEWEWSNYRATAGLIGPVAWLEVDLTLAEFDATNRHAARRLYRRFVAAGGRYEPWTELADQIYLGSPEFRSGLARQMGSRIEEREHPRSQRRPERSALDAVVRCVMDDSQLTLEEILRIRDCDPRSIICWLGRYDSLCRLGEIGAVLRLSDSGVSRLVRHATERLANSDEFRKRLERIVARLRVSRPSTPNKWCRMEI